MYRVFDRVMGVPARDWSGEFLALYGGITVGGKAAQTRRDSSRLSGTAPSVPLERYAGRYADSLYGKVIVRVEDGHRVFSASELLTDDLQHWHHDTFRQVFRKRWIGGGLMSFRMNAEGRVSAVDLGGGRVLDRSR
jgi:hypothetical protein